jgi:hypothetical protein
VKDEEHNYAIFADLSLAPATMQAGKCADTYGLYQGNTTEQSDGESAYTQAKLGGVPTYVRLPRDRWPPAREGKGYVDPVCPLILALYGHPDAGGFWEKHCDAHLKAQGFIVVDQWNSTYWHKGKKLLLVVYVDDFKMSGPKQNMADGWKLISSSTPTTAGITMDKATPSGRYLGCDHITVQTTVPDGFDPRHNGIVEKEKDAERRKTNSADDYMNASMHSIFTKGAAPATKKLKAKGIQASEFIGGENPVKTKPKWLNGVKIKDVDIEPAQKTQPVVAPAAPALPWETINGWDNNFGPNWETSQKPGTKSESNSDMYDKYLHACTLGAEKSGSSMTTAEKRIVLDNWLQSFDFKPGESKRIKETNRLDPIFANEIKNEKLTSM